MQDAPVIIELAINGGVTPERNPHVPLSAAAIIDDCLRCFDAGATVIHAHNHDIRLNQRAGADAYLAAWRPILARRPDALWYPTLSVNQTDGANLEPVQDRFSHYELIATEVSRASRSTTTRCAPRPTWNCWARQRHRAPRSGGHWPARPKPGRSCICPFR